MNKTKYILTLITAQFFVLVIMFPSIKQFSHIFEGHQHDYCGISETHLHEKSLDCDLLKFISSVYYFSNEEITIFSSKDNFKKHTKHYISLNLKNRSQSIYLRGPPSFQQES